MNWYWDLLKKREQMKQQGRNMANSMFLSDRARQGQEVLSQAQSMPAIPEGGISADEFVNNDYYQPRINTPGAGVNTYRGLLDSGYSPQESSGMMGLLQPQSGQKPSTLQQQFEWFSQQPPEVQQQITDFKKAGSQTINVGTNMKPPGGYRFINPEDPQGSKLEKIPGGPATIGTGDQQKKIAAFEGIRGMTNAMQQSLKDGVDPNSLSTAVTGMVKGVPILAGMWESFNGDAKKEAQFLNESENFGNTALQIMRGAQVGPAEQIKFEKSLPTKGMTTAQYENALNTSIRIFNDSMRSTMTQLDPDKPFNPIKTTNLFTTDKAARLEELRRKRNAQ